jgi:hypothetical protein
VISQRIFNMPPINAADVVNSDYLGHIEGVTMKKVFVLASILAIGMPAFAFTPDMDSAGVKKEVSARYNKGESLEVIASAAKSVNMAAAVLAPELLLTGNPAEKVVAAMIKAGYFPTELVDVLDSTGAGGSFGGTSFGNSRASTISGGGHIAVSGS